MRTEGTEAHFRDEDFPDVFHFLSWAGTLCAPRTLQRMRRLPTRKHLLCMLDAYMPYARSRRTMSIIFPVPKDWWPDPELREARALEFRAAVEQWTPPLISSEIIRAARALVHEEGLGDTDEAWDKFDAWPESTPENGLVWPELPEFPTNRKRQG